MDDYDFVPKLKKKASKEKGVEEFKGLLGDDDDDDDDEQVLWKLLLLSEAGLLYVIHL
jgi:hypothetical protein